MLGDQIREVSSYFSKNAKIAFWFLSVVAIMIAVYIPTALPDGKYRDAVHGEVFQVVAGRLIGTVGKEDCYLISI